MNYRTLVMLGVFLAIYSVPARSTEQHVDVEIVQSAKGIHPSGGEQAAHTEEESVDVEIVTPKRAISAVSQSPRSETYHLRDLEGDSDSEDEFSEDADHARSRSERFHTPKSKSIKEKVSSAVGRAFSRKPKVEETNATFYKERMKKNRKQVATVLKLYEEREKLLRKLDQNGKARVIHLLSPLDPESLSSELSKMSDDRRDSNLLKYVRTHTAAEKRLEKIGFFKRWFGKGKKKKDAVAEYAEVKKRITEMRQKLEEDPSIQLDSLADSLKADVGALKYVGKDQEISEVQQMLENLKNSPENFLRPNCVPKRSFLSRLIRRKEEQPITGLGVTDKMIAAASLHGEDNIKVLSDVKQRLSESDLEKWKSEWGNEDSSGMNALGYAVKSLNPEMVAWIIENTGITHLGHQAEDKKIELNYDMIESLSSQVKQGAYISQSGFELSPSERLERIRSLFGQSNSKDSPKVIYLNRTDTEIGPKSAHLTVPSANGKEPSSKLDGATIPPKEKRLEQEEKPLVESVKASTNGIQKEHGSETIHLDDSTLPIQQEHKADSSKDTAPSIKVPAGPTRVQTGSESGSKLDSSSIYRNAARGDLRSFVRLLNKAPAEDKRQILDETLKSSYAEIKRPALEYLLKQGARFRATSPKEKNSFISVRSKVDDRLKGKFEHFVIADYPEYREAAGDVKKLSKLLNSSSDQKSDVKSEILQANYVTAKGPVLNILLERGAKFHASEPQEKDKFLRSIRGKLNDVNRGREQEFVVEDYIE